MRSRIICRVFLALVFGSLLSTGPQMGYAAPQEPETTSVTSAPNELPPYRPGELLIKFNPTRLAEQYQARQALARVGGQHAGNLEALDVERWRVPPGQELALAKVLSDLPSIEYAEPSYLVRAHITPDDAYYSSQWSHPVINSPAAWDFTTGSGTVIVAVIDTGVDLENEDLQGRLTDGIDYANGDSNPDDDNGHGTHVAGIIAAMGNNAQGIAGVAWQTSIMPVKVLDSEGRGYDTDTAEGITWAVDHGAHIINISLGGVNDSTTLHNAVKYAHGNGVLVVASGGNCGDAITYPQNGCTFQDQTIYPAAYAEVFAVAATSEYDTVATFSNQGDYIDIAAPGVDIYSSLLNNSYWWLSGSSQAAPHVAGLAALLLAIDPTLDPAEIREHITAASVDLGSPGDDPDYGAGRINASGALEHATITLDAPTLLTIDNTDRDPDFLVDWSDVVHATSYTLEEDDNVSFSSPATVYSGSASQADITDRSNGTWYYRVRAVRANASLIGDWSNPANVKVGLDTPTLAPIENGGSASFTVTWNAVDGATAYHLQESASADFSGATTHDVSTTSFPVVDQNGGFWYYRVRATTGVIDSNWSAPQSATVLPDPPVLTTIVAGSEPDAYTITWSSSTGATGYRLQESPTTEFTNVITRYVGTGTSYTVTGQSAGTWTYRVEAANSAGYSLPSNSESFTVTVPTIPTPILAPITDPVDEDTYTVSWSEVPDATYILEESTSPWFEAPTIAYTGVLTHHVATDKSAGHYHYRVRAQTLSGSSPWSSIKSVTVWAYIFLPLITR